MIRRDSGAFGERVLGALGRGELLFDAGHFFAKVLPDHLGDINPLFSKELHIIAE